MDYSSISHDAENFSGPSPWASSPQSKRDSFENHPHSHVPNMPSSPIPPHSAHHDPDAHNAHDAGEEATQHPSGPLDPNGASSQPHESAHAAPPTHQQLPPHPQDGEPYPPRHDGPRPTSQRYHGARPGSRQSQQQQQQQPQYRLQAKVMGLERTGRKDPILRFDVYTNLPEFRTTQFRDVRRTHSEFIKLAEHLISSTPEAFVPAVPPPQTPAGVGTDEDETRVKHSMQRWLNIVCANQILIRDDEVVRFVEGDPGYSPVIRKSQPATGVRRKVIKQFAPPPDDTPELQEARPLVKMFYLGSMDAGQKVDKVVKVRRALGLTEVEFGAKLSALSEHEQHSGLKNACRKLGKVVQATGDFHAAQGTAEATLLADPLQYHSSDAFIVKETLTNRHILQRELLQAQQATRTKTTATDRLKASTSVRRDKVDEAITALEDARGHEAYLLQKTQRVTTCLVTEQRKWFARTAADLRASIREYVVREIECERRTLATLESVRPDIRAIDASGGLSRLGRESHPPARRAALLSSQGPKGDAWSGVARRQDASLNRSILSTNVSGIGPAGQVGGAAAGGGSVEEDGGGGVGEEAGGVNGDRARQRQRAVSGAGSVTSTKELDEDDDDKVDARNAASRLAASTF